MTTNKLLSAAVPIKNRLGGRENNNEVVYPLAVPIFFRFTSVNVLQSQSSLGAGLNSGTQLHAVLTGAYGGRGDKEWDQLLLICVSITLTQNCDQQPSYSQIHPSCF